MSTTIGALPVEEIRLDSLHVSSDNGWPDDGFVAEYARILQAGSEPPPIFVLRFPACDVVSDGRHRTMAARAIGRETIRARVLDVERTPHVPRVMALMLADMCRVAALRELQSGQQPLARLLTLGAEAIYERRLWPCGSRHDVFRLGVHPAETWAYASAPLTDRGVLHALYCTVSTGTGYVDTYVSSIDVRARMPISAWRACQWYRVSPDQLSARRAVNCHDEQTAREHARPLS